MTAAHAIAGFLSMLLVPYAAAAPQQPGAEDRPTFRSSVDVVSVAAVVRDRKGRFVNDLSKDDFEVRDGGQRRPILDFRAQADGPVKLALLFDISGSMRVGTKAVDARQAARQLFSALRSGDEAALFTFDTRLEQAHGFTSDLAALEAELDRVEPPYGQTSLYDAIAETARQTAREASGGGTLPQRRAVVVLTDGVDTHSRLTPAQVSAIASGIDIPVYIVAVMGVVDDPAHGGDGGPQDIDASGLRELAQWTGGELFTVSAPAHASVAARQVVGELRHQYLLAVEASARSGWRPLEVRTRKADFVVRARSGYTAGGRTDIVGASHSTGMGESR